MLKIKRKEHKKWADKIKNNITPGQNLSMFQWIKTKQSNSRKIHAHVNKFIREKSEIVYF